MTDSENGKHTVKEFTKCPQCGGEERMFEKMGKGLKERGIMPAGSMACFEMKTGALVNQEMSAKLPIGSELPSYSVVTDVCLDCGCIYAVRLEQSVVKKGIAPVRLVPNREQRRGGMTGGLNLDLLNRLGKPPLN